MRIVVLGATGNIGSRTVSEALAAGHDVVAYARRPQAVPGRAGLTVVGGRLDDVDALSRAADGADALIVSVTGPTKDAGFMQRTLPGLVEASRRAGVRRFVLVSAFGAGDTAAKASWFARLIYRTVLGRFFGDKAASERLLPGSGLDYTIVYPVNLKDAPALPRASVVPLEDVAKVPGLPTLPFGNVATALVDIATDPARSGQRLLITTPTGWRPVR